MMEKLPDAFNDVANVIHSHIKATNILARLQLSQGMASDAAPRAKRGRPPGSKDVQPR